MGYNLVTKNKIKGVRITTRRIILTILFSSFVRCLHEIFIQVFTHSAKAITSTRIPIQVQSKGSTMKAAIRQPRPKNIKSKVKIASDSIRFAPIQSSS